MSKKGIFKVFSLFGLIILAGCSSSSTNIVPTATAKQPIAIATSVINTPPPTPYIVPTATPSPTPHIIPTATPSPTPHIIPTATPSPTPYIIPTTTPYPTPIVHNEQEGRFGANTFTNPHNASGMGQKIPAASWVQVSCKIYAPEITSVNPDGYWYLIASSPWSNSYYAAANTFMNGDPWGGPYSHNTDFNVPNC